MGMFGFINPDDRDSYEGFLGYLPKNITGLLHFGNTFIGFSDLHKRFRKMLDALPAWIQMIEINTNCGLLIEQDMVPGILQTLNNKKYQRLTVDLSNLLLTKSLTKHYTPFTLANFLSNCHFSVILDPMIVNCEFFMSHAMKIHRPTPAFIHELLNDFLPVVLRQLIADYFTLPKIFSGRQDYLTITRETPIITNATSELTTSTSSWKMASASLTSSSSSTINPGNLVHSVLSASSSSSSSSTTSSVITPTPASVASTPAVLPN